MMLDVDGWDSFTEPQKVLALIKSFGSYRLGNWDGCCCSHFSVRNVHVQISCGKGGEQAVWIYSSSCDYDDDKSLRLIMDEVISQVNTRSGRIPNFAQYFSAPHEFQVTA